MKKYLILAFSLLLMWGCRASTNADSSSAMVDNIEAEDLMVPAPATSEEEVETNETGASSISSTAARNNPKDTVRKFIRTANIKFRVKNIERTTYDIENIVSHQDGFVESTSLISSIENVENKSVSADSSLEITHYSVSNTMILRVPVAKMDTTLKEIAKHIDFLDYRTIKSQDVALDILANTLSRKRNTEYVDDRRDEMTKDILANTLSRKQNTEYVDDGRDERTKKETVAEDILNKKTYADQALLFNYTLADKIEYCTINLYIYQRSNARFELLVNDKNIDSYEPSFGCQFVDALKISWDILAVVLLFLTKTLGLVALFVAIYILIRRYGYLLTGKKDTKK